MSSALYECPVCSLPLEVGSARAGQAMRCGNCGGAFRTPAGPVVLVPVECPRCQAALEVETRFAGRSMACGVCRSPFRVPRELSAEITFAVHPAWRQVANGLKLMYGGGLAVLVTGVIIVGIYVVLGFLEPNLNPQPVDPQDIPPAIFGLSAALCGAVCVGFFAAVAFISGAVMTLSAPPESKARGWLNGMLAAVVFVALVLAGTVWIGLSPPDPARAALDRALKLTLFVLLVVAAGCFGQFLNALGGFLEGDGAGTAARRTAQVLLLSAGIVLIVNGLVSLGVGAGWLPVALRYASLALLAGLFLAWGYYLTLLRRLRDQLMLATARGD